MSDSSPVPSRRARTVAIIGQLAFVGLVLWAIVILRREVDQLGPDLRFEWSWLVWTLAAKFGAVLCLALKFREQCRLTGVELSPREWFGLSAIATFHAYLSPAQTGHAMRAVYLRRRYSLGYEAYAVQTLGVNLLEVMLAGVLGASMCLILGGTALSMLPVMFAAILIPWALVLLAPSTRRVTVNWAPKILRRWLLRAFDSLDRVLSARRTMWRLAGWSVLSILLRWLGLYCSFPLCGFEAGKLETLLIESARTAAMVVTITPGNLGLTEGLIAGIATLLGMSAAAALAAAVVSRLLSMAIHGVLGLWYTRVFALALASE